MLCAVPALRALRQWCPSSEFILIGLPWTAQLLPRYQTLIDRVIVFPGHPELPEQAADPEALERFFFDVRSIKADLAIQMHGSGVVSNRIVERCGARQLAGFSIGESKSDGFISWPEKGQELRRCLRLARALGARHDGGESLYFPIIAEDLAELAGTGLPAELDGEDYICIHAGARSPDRRWPASCFVRVADALAAAGFKIVLTGSGSEWPLAEQVRQQMRHPAVNAALPCSLGALAALLRNARLLVCNDTGVSHLAVALELPSVVIFSTSDPERWAPLDTSLHPIVIDREGLRVNEVLASCQSLLAHTAQ